MATTVEVGVVRGFVLDDPVRGVLDNTVHTLAGVTFVDVSDRVSSVSIQRGKNRDLDTFSAATLSVSLNNEDRFFDPVEGTDIDTIPRVPVRVSVDGDAQFTGSANTWQFDYDIAGASKVSIAAADNLQRLANQVVEPGVTPPVELSGARVERVLDMFTVDWPDDARDIDAGSVSLCDVPFDGENALEYLQLVERTEQGALFIGKNGDLVFRSRDAAAARSDDLVLFSDNGAGVPYSDLTLDFGSEQFFNRVVVSAPGGTAVANNFLSQGLFGISELELDVLCSSLATAQGIADFLSFKFGEPKLRFENITVNLRGVSPTDRANVLGLELGDVVQVQFTPNGQGAEIDRFAQIIGIDHSVGVDRHEVSFSFDSLEFSPFVLDDVVFGKLDLSQLGF